MRCFLVGAIAVLLLAIPSLPAFAGADAPVRLAQASEPADNSIKAAIADVDRFEKQAQSMRPGASTAKRTLKLLGLTEGRLNSSTNKAHPSWIETNERLQALKQRLTDLAAGKTPGAPPAKSAAPTRSGSQPTTTKKAPATTNAASASEQRVGAALKRMRELEVSAERITAAQPQAAAGIVNGLTALSKGMVVSEDKQDSRWGGLVQRYQKLRGAMVQIVVDSEAKRVAKSVADNMRTLGQTDALTVQAEAETQKWRAAIAEAQQRQKKFADQKNANVIALGEKIGEFEKLLESKLAFKLAAERPFWSGDWPEDKPVLIDSLGNAETIFKVQPYPTRPVVWVPEPTLFVRFADYETDDVIVMEVMKDGKPIGKPMKCGAKAASVDVTGGRVHSSYAKAFKKAALIAFSCRPKKEFGLTESGVLMVRVSYRQTLLDVNHHLADLRLHVREVQHCSQNNPCTTYTEDLDARMSVATLEESSDSIKNSAFDHFYSSIASAQPAPDTVSNATIRFWLKDDDSNALPKKATCYYGKKKLAQAQTGSSLNRGYWSHTKDGKINVHWHHMKAQFFTLLIRPARDGSRGNYAGDVHFLSDNPGDYRCVVTGDGEILKEIYFTVGEDGEVAKPACQAASMKSLGRVTLLTKQKNMNVATNGYDAKIGKKLGFNGNVKWSGGCPLIE